MIIDHSNGRVLEVLKDREKATVAGYLKRAKESGLLACVEEVTIDMWEGYKNAAVEVFGVLVRIVVDRFHVMKLFQECLCQARRDIQRSLPAEEARELKGTRWLWQTNWDNLDREQRARLEELKARFPALKGLWQQREGLRGLFEDKRARSIVAGMRRLRLWVEQARASGLVALEKFCQTVDNWREEIAGYFVARSSNGRTEGFNHGLRAILWRAFGMQNFEHFRLRVLDRFGRPKAA